MAAIWRGERISPSVSRKPVARSISSPGVRISVATDSPLTMNAHRLLVDHVARGGFHDLVADHMALETAYRTREGSAGSVGWRAGHGIHHDSGKAALVNMASTRALWPRSTFGQVKQQSTLLAFRIELRPVLVELHGQPFLVRRQQESVGGRQFLR